VTFSLHENDRKLVECGKNKVMEVMRAAGAQEVVQEARYAHLVGGARMGRDLRNSVVDGFGRTDDIANLFVCDGSILPTQGSANPGLTIQALAARTADYLISEAEAIFRSNRRNLTRPPIRRHLSPPGTHGRGVPRLGQLTAT
jgi:choline dehydrogenase-like flavoprotein